MQKQRSSNALANSVVQSKPEKTMNLHQLLKEVEKAVVNKPAKNTRTTSSRSPIRNTLPSKIQPVQPTFVRSEQVVKTDIEFGEFKDLITVMKKPNSKIMTNKSKSPIRQPVMPTRSKSPILRSQISERQLSKSPMSSQRTTNISLLSSKRDSKIQQESLKHSKSPIREQKSERSLVNSTYEEFLQHQPISQSEIDNRFTVNQNFQPRHPYFQKIDQTENDVNLNNQESDLTKSAPPVSDFERRLMEFENRKKQNLQKLKKEFDPTFKPELNKKSVLLDQKRMRGIDNPRYENLYELDAVLKMREQELKNMVIEERLEKFEREELQNCTFKPKINQSMVPVEYGHESIPERQLMWKKKKDDRLAQQRVLSQVSELLDCTFQPSLEKKAISKE